MTTNYIGDSFDLPAFLLGEVYGPMRVDGQHIQWTAQDSLDLASDLYKRCRTAVDPSEITEIMLEFDKQDNGGV